MSDGEVISQITFFKHYGIACSAAIKMLQAGGSNAYGQAHLAFYTSNDDNPYTSTPTERLRITSGGNVGIGCISPNYILHTKDMGTASSNAYFGTGVVRIGGGADAGSNQVLSLAPGRFGMDNPGVGNGRFIIEENGRVGIGCAQPGVSLVVGLTDALRLPTGTTAQRPTTACSLLRFNSDLRMFDGAGADSWGPLGVAERIIMNNYNPYCTNATALCIVDNADGGGTPWEFTNSGMFGVVNSSGGHSGQWGPLVYMTPGAWRWRWTAVPTMCDGSIHPNTPAAAYKCTIQTSFNINGVSTGDIKYDTCIFFSNMHVGGLSTPTYITTAGCFTVSFSTNGYEGVRKIWFKELVLEKIR
jgi:hypothetical protein